MRIAITGPTGSIGTELIKCAVERGDEVIAIIRPGSQRAGKISKSNAVKVIECDISDYKSIENIEKCDVFFHLAWMKTFGTDRDDTFAQIENIRFSVDAVNLAASWDAKVFVGAGSQAEYGPVSVPLNENTPVNPSSGYGIAKYAAGKMCALQCKKKGIRFNWARILSVFGENDADYTLIMYLIDTLMNEEMPELTKCEQTWDYIYSKDCADALLKIGDKGKDGRTYCIGSGSPRSLREYVEAIRDLINPNLELNFGAKEYYPHQPMYLVADISDLRKDTGFMPHHSFEDGISNIIRNKSTGMNVHRCDR